MPGWRNFMEFHHQNGDRDLIRLRTGGVRWSGTPPFPIQTWISHPQQNVMEWNLQNWKGGPSPQMFIMFSICVQWPQPITSSMILQQERNRFFLNLVKPKHYESIFDPQSHCGRSGRTVNLCCRAAISPLMTLKSSVGPTVSSSWKLGMVGSPGFHGGWHLWIIIIINNNNNI